MRINYGLGTPGGPHFPVAPGVTLRAHTFPDLFELITEWRTRNGVEVGNPQRDVDNYVCSQWPHFCHKESNDGPPPSQRGKTMSSRVTTWAILRAREQPPGGYDMVSNDESEKRAQICAKCPLNVAWVGCQNCHQSTLSILSVVRKLRGTSLDNSLLACEACGHDNRTAVHLPLEILKPMDPQEQNHLPPGCWKKTK